MLKYLKKIAASLYASLPEPNFTRPRNLKLFEWMNINAPGKKVLNLGSGVGRFDHHLSRDITMVNLDVDPSLPGVDVVADAHQLPFPDASFDVVYSIAVLEHVKKPWIVAGEIWRVLKPGGHVVLELPFLNVIHSEHDYFRFTDKGIRELFDVDRFDVIFEQVGSGGGSFLSVFLVYYFVQFVPTKILKAIWSAVTRYVFSLVRYIDIFITDSRELRITANSFSFVGRKK